MPVVFYTTYGIWAYGADVTASQLSTGHCQRPGRLSCNLAPSKRRSLPFQRESAHHKWTSTPGRIYALPLNYQQRRSPEVSGPGGMKPRYWQCQKTSGGRHNCCCRGFLMSRYSYVPESPIRRRGTLWLPYFGFLKSRRRAEIDCVGYLVRCAISCNVLHRESDMILNTVSRCGSIRWSSVLGWYVAPWGCIRTVYHRPRAVSGPPADRPGHQSRPGYT